MKIGDPVVEAICRALRERERYFDRRGVLNSDGRKLVARAAREARSLGLHISAERAWELLRDPTMDKAVNLVVSLRGGCL